MISPLRWSGAMLAACSFLLVLVACGDQRAPGAASNGPAGGSPEAGAPVGAAPSSPWELRISGAGASLAHVGDGTGSSPLRIACLRDPAGMALESETTAPIASEERFSFGVDGEVWAFVADVAGATAEPQGGVRGERPIDEEVLAAVENAREIGASYGATALGPYPAPTPEDRANFVAACRQIVRG